MTKNFSELVKDTNEQIQESQMIMNRTHKKKYTPRSINLNFKNTMDKKKKGSKISKDNSKKK